MKVIDKSIVREKERDLLSKKSEQLRKEAEKKKEESKIPKIRVISDWRIEQEYNKAIADTVLFAHQIVERKELFLKESLENRDKLKELVVEAYEPNRRDPIIISIESTKEYIETLEGEARNLGLTYDQYIRAIYYTSALEINKKKLESAARLKEKQEEARLFDIKGQINQELRKKLDSKYGEPVYDTELFNICAYGYTEMLIDLAKEYFKIDK